MANIGALFSSIKFFFSFIFSFYSNNFNNYKIIEKILNPPKEVNRKIELSSNINEPLSNDQEDNIKNDDNPLIDKESNEIQLNINDSEKDENIEDNNTNKKFSIVLNKMHFYDYYYNNIYSKCCKKRKNQEILNITNKIIYKYLSIDSLLYNQIKIEQLLNDYKWNDQSLNNIQNNKMIIKLKNI